MRSLNDIFDGLQARQDCVFRPPTRMPTLPGGLHLPPDLAAFYSRFSEAKLASPDEPQFT